MAEYDPFDPANGNVDDWLYENDTCYFCGAPRTRECQHDGKGWACPKCGGSNPDGSGKNNPHFTGTE